MRPIINDNSSRNKFIVFLEALIRLVLTAVLWYFLLLHIFEMLVLHNYVKTIQVFEFLGLISIVAFIVLFAWQRYNLHLFGSLDRRKARSAATAEDVADRFAISEQSLVALSAARRLNLRKLPTGGNEYYADSLTSCVHTKLDPAPLVFNRKSQVSDTKK